jgi:hypothetical protein
VLSESTGSELHGFVFRALEARRSERHLPPSSARRGIDVPGVDLEVVETPLAHAKRHPLIDIVEPPRERAVVDVRKPCGACAPAEISVGGEILREGIQARAAG